MIELALRSENEMTYEEAVLYCQFCRYNGYSDWRMPTKKEYLLNSMHGWYINRYDSDRNRTLFTWWVGPVRDV